MRALRSHVRQQIVALNYPLHRQCRGAGERMPHVGMAVLKRAGPSRNNIKYLVLHQQRADRCTAAAETLGEAIDAATGQASGGRVS